MYSSEHEEVHNTSKRGILLEEEGEEEEGEYPMPGLFVLCKPLHLYEYIIHGDTSFHSGFLFCAYD